MIRWSVILSIFAFTGITALSVPAGVKAQARATPTPLPQIQGTITYAEQLRKDANEKMARADELYQQSLEMRQNGIAQSEEASRANADARMASSIQNAVAFGEAIGRSEENVRQLSASNEGQANIIATLSADNRLLAASVLTLTQNVGEVNRQKSQLIVDNAALKKNSEDAAQKKSNDDIVQYGIWMFVAVVIVVTTAILIGWYIARTREVKVVRPARRDVSHEVVEGEFVESRDENASTS